MPRTSTTRKKSASKRNSVKSSAVKGRVVGTAAAKKVTKKTTKKKTTAKKSATKKAAAKSGSKGKRGKSTSKAKAPKVTPQILRDAYQNMVRARLVDEKTIVLYKQNKCHFQIGCAGHECIQAAAAAAFTEGTDWFFPYYRDMGLMASLGMTSEEFMLNAMNKRDDPNSHGRQMPVHYSHVSKRVVSQSSPTGTQYTQAVGVALGAKVKGLQEVVYVSSGEGTAAQGDFHEAINWAAREKLPVVFVIQNNGFAISVPVKDQIAGESVAGMVSGYENLHSEVVDGTDFEASFKAMSLAHQRALAGDGPTLIEAMVPRLQSHSISDNHLKYRTQKEIDKEAKRDPIALLKKLLVKKKIASKKELEALDAEIKASIDVAAEWAEAQPDPAPDTALDYTFSDPRPSFGLIETEATGEDNYIVDALNHGLAEEMERNEDLYIFGEDVAGGKGGVFTVTAGLTDRFGEERVFNSHLAESSIVGAAIGMASRGLKPVAEIQFGDYVWTAMMQIRNELAMMHYRCGGEWKCPAVLRIPVGGYIRGAAYHSQCIEGTFSHFPGLYVVMPSNATDAKGLLKSAIRCDNPVLFLEHKGLYRQVYAKGPEGDADFLTPIGKAKVVREGSDLTIISWGALVQKSILTAEALAKEGASVEVIDIRSIVPLDTETIFNSVRKTNRVLIAHEDVTFMGFGAEVAAGIADNCFADLDAPIKRVGMKYAAAVPHQPALEDVVLPQTDDVLTEARALLSY